MEKRRFIGKRTTWGESYALDAAYQRTQDQDGGEEVARYPSADYHATIEGDQVVIRRGISQDEKTDLFEMGTQDRQPPRTLAEMNGFLRHFYRKPRLSSARR